MERNPLREIIGRVVRAEGADSPVLPERHTDETFNECVSRLKQGGTDETRAKQICGGQY